MEPKMVYLVLVGVSVVFGFIGQGMAEKRNQSKGNGFALGFFLWILGLLIIGMIGYKS